MGNYIPRPRAVCRCCGEELPKNAKETLCAICKRRQSSIKDYAPPDWSLTGKPLELVAMEAKAFALSYGRYTAAVQSGQIIHLLFSMGLSKKEMRDILNSTYEKYKKSKKLYPRKKNYAGF